MMIFYLAHCHEFWPRLFERHVCSCFVQWSAPKSEPWKDWAQQWAQLESVVKLTKPQKLMSLQSELSKNSRMWVFEYYANLSEDEIASIGKCLIEVKVAIDQPICPILSIELWHNYSLPTGWDLNIKTSAWLTAFYSFCCTIKTKEIRKMRAIVSRSRVRCRESTWLKNAIGCRMEM